MPDAGPTGLELGQRVAIHDSIELGVAERAERLVVGDDQQLAADARSVDHGRQGNRSLGAQELGEALEDAHQSSSSMNNRIVPPHVRPTANASSSL